MPLPPGITTRTYSGTIVGLDGTNATGTLEFRQPHPIRDLDDNVVVGPRQPLTATVAAGAFTIDLPRSDTPYIVRIDTDAIKDVYALTVDTDATSPITFASTYGTAATADLVEFYALLGHAHGLGDLTGVDLTGATDGQLLGLVGTTWQPVTPDTGGIDSEDFAPATRQILAGTGLTGGGDLSADRTLAVQYGTTAGTAVQGNDTRLSDARTPTAHTHPVSDVTGLQATLDTKADVTSVLDQVAVRYACKALSFDPHELSHVEPTNLALTSQRLYVFWLPLPTGTILTGVRVPIAAIATGSGGELHFTAYQQDLSQMATSGNVAPAFSTGSASEWRIVPFTTPGTTTGSGVWLTAHSTIPADGPKTMFCHTGGAPALPEWLLNPADRKTCLRIEGVPSPPATLDLTSAVDYIDFLIGIY